MADIHEGEVEFKSYDPKIMKRLLKYAKPYAKWLVLSIVLLIGIVGIELIQPVIVGKAVDSIINAYDKTYSIVEKKDSDLEIKGYYLKQDSQNQYKNNLKAQMIYVDKNYYLVTGLTYEEAKYLQKNKDTLDEFKWDGSNILINKNYYKAYLLNRDELKMLRSKDIDALKKISLIFLAVILLGLIISYVQTLVLQYTGQKIIYNIRNEVFTHIQGLSIQFFNANPVGKLVTRVTNDTETLNEMYTSVIVNSFKNVFMLLGIIIIMLIINVRLSLIVFLVIPLIVISTIIFRKCSTQAYREIRTRVAKINTFLSEHIAGMKIVQIFSQEKRVFERFNKINDDLKKSNIKQLIIFGIYRPSMYLLYILGIALVIVFGGNMVLKNTLTIGTLIIFIQYVSRFFDPIQQLAEQFNILQSAMAAAEKIFTLLDTDIRIESLPNGYRSNDIKGHIEFRNVWFAYEKDNYVLRDVSFEVKPGETVAFVGATGAGKTSILNLISRYYDVQKGEILIDGKNVKEWDLNNLRSHIGQMLQDVFIFTGDIKSNIRLNDEEITIDQIIEASKYVNADSFISKLPNKYDEKVYENGATLSAGQRQLISFARTLVHNPSILMLDEATANIDTETEQLIQDGLQKLMKGRTTLVVAHRLSTIQHADKIIVLHKGKIREMGNHQQLLAKKGLYYKLYELQYKDQDNA